jgi:hypothetical protein
MLIQLAKDESKQPEYVIHLNEKEMLILRSICGASFPTLIHVAQDQLLQNINNETFSRAIVTELNRLKEMQHTITTSHH